MYLLVGLVIGALLSFILTHARVLRRQRAVVAADDVDGPSTRAESASRPADASIDVVNLRDSPELLVHQTRASPNGHSAIGARDAGGSHQVDG
jgi:hypothetical protein